MPKISIIVPVYKAEQYLHRCLNSILTQTYADFELLLVEDGSPDKSGDICDEYAVKDKRIRVFHQNNRGQAVARNFALDWIFVNSDSKFISFIDSDDWVHPRYLELLLRGLEKTTDNISQCNYLETDGTKEIPDVGNQILSITVEEQYIHKYSGIICAKMYRRELWREIRFPEGQVYEDVAIWYRILFKEQRIALVDETLYYYFINIESTVRKDWTPARYARVTAWDRQIKFLTGYPNEAIFQNAISRYASIIKGQYEEVYRSKAVSLLTKLFYKARLKLKMGKILKNYREELESENIYSYFVEWAFPALTWVCWTAIGVLNRTKRIIRRDGKQ